MEHRNSLRTLKYEEIFERSRFFKILSLISDFMSKTLTVITPIISATGVFLVLFYLKKVGLEREFISVISSPTVLIAIALYSIFIAIFFALLLLLPGTLVFLGSLQWESEKYSKSKGDLLILISFLFMFSLLTLTLSLYFSDVKTHERLGLLIIALVFCLGLLISSRQSWLYEKRPLKLKGLIIVNKCNAKSFFISAVSTSLGISILLFSIFLMLKAMHFLIGNDGVVFWVTLSAVYLFYSILVASVISFRDSLFFAYLFFLISSVISLLFQSEVSSNVVSQLGLGNFSSSYTVRTESISNIKKDMWKNKDGEYLIRSIDNVAELKNIWVLLSLKDKVIISPSNSSEVWVSIPTSAIVNEGAL